MPPLDLSDALANPDLPDGLAVAGTYPDYTDAFQHSVVILAMGESCWIIEADAQHRLLVEPALLPAAREQLARFDRESARWPPPPLTDSPALRTPELLTPLLWSAAILAIFHAQTTRPALAEFGAMDAQALFRGGEWWRPITALFLHGNAAHVISNALSGLLVFTALLTTLGRARGWLLLGISAVLGNVAVAVVNHAREYRSLGASTAIFAALGLLTGRAVRVVCRAGRPRRWRAMFAPAAAGLIVLGLYGAGGAHVDVPAHFTGFTAGAVLGFTAGLPPRPV